MTSGPATGAVPRARRFVLDTPSGPAWADVLLPRRRIGLLAIGHGAGGSVEAPDIRAAAAAGLAAGWAVALVTQPYRVAGRRSPAPAARLDEAWIAVLRSLRRRASLRRLPLVAAGRSSGARVACRTASELGAHGVLCLAFPVHPPGRPDQDRTPELDAVAVPILVVQGDRDPFGMPSATLRRVVHVVAGADHGLKKPSEVGGPVTAFLTTLITSTPAMPL